MYVDDILVTSYSSELIGSFVKRLNAVFSLKDLGELHFFLGTGVNISDARMFLSQRGYLMSLLEKFNMPDASSSPIPITLGKHRTKVKEEALRNPALYRSLVGGLQYLTNMRPNISFTVNQLSQHLSSPTTLDWQKAKRTDIKVFEGHG